MMKVKKYKEKTVKCENRTGELSKTNENFLKFQLEEVQQQSGSTSGLIFSITQDKFLVKLVNELMSGCVFTVPFAVRLGL